MAIKREEVSPLEEVWKDIDGFPNYQVSDKSRVKNKRTGQILKPCLDISTGYLTFNLYNSEGKPRHKYLHRLVAEAFIPNPENKPEVNHRDGNKANPDISNLEWATNSENMKHAFEHGLCENTRKAAYEQQQILAQKPRTQRQRDAARENIIKTNQRPKTEKQLEVARQNINSPVCRSRAAESRYDRHPPIKLVETGEIFRSQRELAELLGINESAICAVLHGRRENASGYHFEYITEEPKPEKPPFLYPHQEDAIKRMFNGCVLNGTVGSGKSRTGIYYYFQLYGGHVRPFKHMRMGAPDLIIITTAKKRTDLEWESELVPFLLSTKEQDPFSGARVYVDSWNNIKKYENRTGCFVIFDENKTNGKGAWANAFLKMTKNNEWILLSASNGDRWTDYETLFVAEGFFRNRTEFRQQHLIINNYAGFPQVTGYRGEERLFRLRERVLVDMDFKRKTTQHHEDVYVKYDIQKYKEVIRTRWDIYRNEPITRASGLCHVLRRIVNEDESRQVALLELLEDHPKAIIFYNHDNELDILLNLGYSEGTVVAQYNGHKHEPIPEGDKWVYLVNYNACEAWNTTSTNCIIFFSQNYSYKVMIQAAGRIDRLTTPFTDLYYYHLKSRSGIDLAISKALKDKKKFNEKRWTKWDEKR